VRGLEPGAVHHVALGARLGDRFVPFARAGGVATPTDAPLTYRHAPAAAPAPDATAADNHDAPAAPLSVEAAHARWAAGLASS
jgi:hypothetical protein